jgi:hypothetical protein
MYSVDVGQLRVKYYKVGSVLFYAGKRRMSALRRGAHLKAVYA